MFDRLAPGYRRFNAWASLGQDFRWRRRLAEEAGPARRVLDLGAGTGEVAGILASRNGKSVVAADVSMDMLRRIPQPKAGGGRVPRVLMEGHRLPFADGAFDAVVSAYVLRNLIQGGVLAAVLGECARILAPGGRMIHLDLTRPSVSWLRWSHGVYNRFALPLVGRWAFGRDWPGDYLRRTIAALPNGAALRPVFESAGFGGFRVRPLSGGIVSLFSASKG
jgi:demethylmenaquinone methyltransferase/2-methoxy-6-polyprenyl-1,4-benzoquinol methylase